MASCVLTKLAQLVSSPTFHHIRTQANLKRSKQYRTFYKFRFVSLVAPLSTSKSTPLNLSGYFPLPTRTLTRRSYTLASWIYYLSAMQSREINVKTGQESPTIAILPSRRSLYTLQRAPMAHKTNSKEQFLVKTYNFTFSFKVPTSVESVVTSQEACAHALVLTKRLFPVFETNLLSLKYYLVSYNHSDSRFFRTL